MEKEMKSPKPEAWPLTVYENRKEFVSLCGMQT